MITPSASLPASPTPQSNPSDLQSGEELQIDQTTLLSTQGLEKDSDWLGEKLHDLCDELGLSKPEDLIAIVVQWAHVEKEASIERDLNQIKKVLDDSIDLGILTKEEAIERLEKKRKDLKKPPLLDALLNNKEQETLYRILMDSQSDIEAIREEIRIIIRLFFGKQ
ncbi:hypothetical protein JJD41_18895 [Oxynema sp. CENA135]|uniref:hypothetical protein n=1 Tax=Oxynema sp. CENA135 TaxID=984206 RepID=UPI00190AD64D|nr:hypothetical protein [Oxynema sp. CENA135]MBK4731922.1 hypothetical protein [Oxynema sp. CENA135]